MGPAHPNRRRTETAVLLTRALFGAKSDDDVSANSMLRREVFWLVSAFFATDILGTDRDDFYGYLCWREVSWVSLHSLPMKRV